MQDSNQEIYFVVVVAIILGLVLVGFIVTILYLYQRRQYQQEQEMLVMKDSYDQEVLRSQIEIQENTFRTIAQELHDNIGQLLSVVKISLSILPIDASHPAWEPIQNSRQILNKAIIDLSGLTKSLHTDRISDIGLAAAIQSELDSIQRTGIAQVHFQVVGEELQFDDQKRIFLFRIFQEIINNILKHSKASTIKVSLRFTDGNLFEMAIEDNGIGFNVEEKRQSSHASKGVGLKSIFNRAYLIGARISMNSEPGNGTHVVIKVDA